VGVTPTAPSLRCHYDTDSIRNDVIMLYKTLSLAVETVKNMCEQLRDWFTDVARNYVLQFCCISAYADELNCA